MKKLSLVFALVFAYCLSAFGQQCLSSNSELVFPNNPITSVNGITIFASEQSSNSVIIAQQDDQWRSRFPNSQFTQSGLTNFSNENYQLHGNPGLNIYRVMTRNIIIEENHCFGAMSNTGIMMNTPTLENTAPKPMNGSTGLQTNYNSYVESMGDCNSLNALYFEFKNNSNGFGAWFGDLEGRIDAIPIRIRLFNEYGNRIGNDFIIAESIAPFGNGTTRWIGFKSAIANVKSMMVIVGSNGSDGDGKCNHLSFVGGTAPNPFTPTSSNASISGRFITPTSVGIPKANIKVTNLSTGEIKRTRSSSFGYFMFDDLPVMNTYNLEVEAKWYQSSTLVFLMEDSVINIVSE